MLPGIEPWDAAARTGFEPDFNEVVRTVVAGTVQIVVVVVVAVGANLCVAINNNTMSFLIYLQTRNGHTSAMEERRVSELNSTQSGHAFI